MFKKFLTSKITRGRLDNFISKYRDSDKLTLDLGSRNSPYREYFKNIIGLDISVGKNVDVVGDAHNLPFEEDKFDIILCIEALEHFHNPIVAISEMRRVLKNNGLLILSTRFVFPIHDAPGDYYRYTKYGLKNLFKDWEIVELNEEVSTKNTIAVLLQRIAFQCNFRGGSFTKILIFLIAKFIYFSPSLIKEEFGDYAKSVKDKNIMTSGYYLICKNSK